MQGEISIGRYKPPQTSGLAALSLPSTRLVLWLNLDQTSLESGELFLELSIGLLQRLLLAI